MTEKRFWQKWLYVAGGPLAVVLLLLNGWHFDLFHMTRWYDMMLHFLGGCVVVVSYAGTAWNLWLKKRTANMPPIAFLKAGLIAGLLLTSIAWEIFEVIVGMTPNWTHSASDTFSDMLCALAGAAVTLRLIRFR
ncbi:MAG: hypothetical protein AB7T27_08885 [Kiritimatiellia bacterium]